MNWKPEVKVDGQWAQNALVFATQIEAAESAMDLYSRWTLTTDHRAVETNDPVNYKWVNGRLVKITESTNE